MKKEREFLNEAKNEKSNLLNDSFIEEVRLMCSTTNFVFINGLEKDIVPENLTHNYLMSNLNIDENIERFYYAPTRDLISEKDYNKMVDSGYVGNINTTLKPYPIIVFGAYFGRKAMLYRLLGLMNHNKDVTLNGLTIKYFSDLLPYFKEYADGFTKGFSNFKTDWINPFSIEKLSDKNDFINKVFEFLTKNIAFKHSWFNNHSGFSMNGNNEIINGFEDGVKQGYFYKAWSIVFLYNQLFKPLFEAYYEEKSNPKKEDDKYKPKEIKIAYFCLKNKSITKDNYLEILEEYSNSRSDKILQKPIFKSNQLTNISENKTADTKHLNALKNAKRLLSGIKDEEALKSINQFISTFETDYKNYYE